MLNPIIRFPAIYERITNPRTDEQIWAELEARFMVDSSPRYKASTPLAPPPVDTHVAPTKFHDDGRRGGRNGGCGPNEAARKRQAAKDQRDHCLHPKWTSLGNAKTPGKTRIRCLTCLLEKTVDVITGEGRDGTVWQRSAA